jgi:hypothetical protein
VVHCGNGCPGNNEAICVNKVCDIACATNRSDCDRNPSNGCETDLTTASNCGQCGNQCGSGAPYCENLGGAFQCVSNCGSGLTLCGNECVDTATSPAHCGACGNGCPDAANGQGSCENSRCQLSCFYPFQNCDADAINGCEANTSNDPNHCDGCRSCIGGVDARCENFTCKVRCTFPSSDCDLNPANGCEVADASANHDQCGSDCRNCGQGTCNGSGQCLCPPGQDYCESDRTICTDIFSNNLNCGQCGRMCGQGFTCSSGECVPAS